MALKILVIKVMHAYFQDFGKERKYKRNSTKHLLVHYSEIFAVKYIYVIFILSFSF